MEPKVLFHDSPGGVFVVETHIPVGTMLGSHRHSHPHFSVLVSGDVMVTIEGIVRRYTGFMTIEIPANVTHSVEALTDAIWLCVWREDLADKAVAKESLSLLTCERVSIRNNPLFNKQSLRAILKWDTVSDIVDTDRLTDMSCGIIGQIYFGHTMKGAYFYRLDADGNLYACARKEAWKRFQEFKKKLGEQI